MAGRFLTEAVVINATPERIWDVLTNPDLTEKYMFGCRALSDWKVGSPLTWEMVHEGKKLVAVKGTVVEIQPSRLLRYTVFDPNGTYRDVPSNYLTVTCRVSPAENGQRLEFVQGDFSTVDEGEKRYNDSAAGGDALLLQIKALAEAR